MDFGTNGFLTYCPLDSGIVVAVDTINSVYETDNENNTCCDMAADISDRAACLQ
jgi:hypothetical protein